MVLPSLDVLKLLPTSICKKWSSNSWTVCLSNPVFLRVLFSLPYYNLLFASKQCRPKLVMAYRHISPELNPIILSKKYICRVFVCFSTYCSVLFKWEFFIQIWASCLSLSFHQKRGAIEKGWVQLRPFSFEWNALIWIGVYCKL